MRFFKDLGGMAGTVFGAVTGGATYLVGDIIGSDFIKEIGEDVYKASSNAGKMIGQAADGVVEVAGGIISANEHSVNKGFQELGDAVSTTAQGLCNGVANIASNGANVVQGVLDGNQDQILQGAKNLIKTAAVTTLAVGVADYVGIIGDDLDNTSSLSDVHIINDSGDFHSIDNTYSSEDAQIHDVQPNWVNGYIRSDGVEVDGYWRDGDGDPNTHLTNEDGGGYLRSNPDESLHNNIG